MEELFKPISKDSAVDYVVNQIKQLLITGKIKPGDKLPSEFEIAEGLGVSRGSVRSAMKVFESYGVVDIRPGDGTYVCTSLNKKSFNPIVFSLLILNPSMDILTQFREKIELDILELIIKNEKLSKDILPLIEQNLCKLNELRNTDNPSIDAFAKNDEEFHYILASNCGNIVFETVYRFVFEFFYPYIVNSHHNQSNGMIAADAHQNIFAAIKSGDYNLAKAAIKESISIWYDLLK